MDPIANMLVNLQNSFAASKKAVVPVSKIKIKILEILKDNGYISNFEVSDSKPQTLLVTAGKNPVGNISRLSKPGRRLYTKASELSIKPGSLLVISTPKGLFTAKEARKQNLGGELLFEVKQ